MERSLLQGWRSGRCYTTPSRQTKYSWTWSDGLRFRSLCGALFTLPPPRYPLYDYLRRSGVLSSRSAPALHTYRHFWHFLSLSNSSCLINEITAPRNSPPWWFAFQSVSLKTINNIRAVRDWHSVFLPRRFLLPQLIPFHKWQILSDVRNILKGNDIFESKVAIAPIEDYKLRVHIILPLKE